MISPTSIENATDSDLWALVCQGSAEAFEVILRRYQSLVCAVAYSSCGELAQSEDVAQETFWTAWRGRKSLDQPGKLRSWLCGIARNLGKNARRHASRPVERAESLDTLSERSSDAPGPVEVAISREEESLIWQTLEQIPETFREPLILFYRENQSVVQVASALELSEAAVKQRLSRGRSMLREQVGGLVEEGLRRSRPGRKFSVVVMAGITAGTAGAKTAGAAGAGAGAKLAMPLAKIAAGAGLSGGLLGGLLGSLGGLFGSWLGVWLPAQLAATVSERNLIWRTGRRILLASVVAMVLLALLIVMAQGDGRSYLIAFGLWLLTFQTYIMIETIRLARAVRQMRQNESSTAEPNPAKLRRGVTAVTSRYRGRVWRSQASLFGLPLIDINVSDPCLSHDSCGPNSKPPAQKTARGWIAIGDDARGYRPGDWLGRPRFYRCGRPRRGGLEFRWIRRRSRGRGRFGHRWPHVRRRGPWCIRDRRISGRVASRRRWRDRRGRGRGRPRDRGSRGLRRAWRHRLRPRLCPRLSRLGRPFQRRCGPGCPLRRPSSSLAWTGRWPTRTGSGSRSSRSPLCP